MNKVVRCQIVKPVDMDWKQFGDILYELQYEAREIKNKTMFMYHEWVQYCTEQENLTGKKPKVEDVYGFGTIEGYINHVISAYGKINYSSNVTSLIRNIRAKYDTLYKDILAGRASVPNAGKNQPIDLHNKSIRIFHDDAAVDYYAVLSLLSGIGKHKWNTKTGQITVLLKTSGKSNSVRKILDSCIKGEYKVRGSQILRVDGKIYLNLCYEFAEEKDTSLDKNKIMGVDLGIAVPAYMAFNFDRYDRAKVEDNRIMQRKYRLDKELSQAKKCCTFTNDGHGRANKMRCYEKYSHKSRNFSDTLNHKWAKYIVEQAVKHGCATIQMEDLTAIKNAKPKKKKSSGKNNEREEDLQEELQREATATLAKNKFLKNWTYYDLQTKIQQKAAEKGISVVKVNPKYTSQRCSECGCISPRNRPEQKTFHCISCGYSENADFNAARNLSVSGIEKIISSTPVTE